MRKLRLSYSLLDKWVHGDKDGAMETYLRIDTKTSRAIEKGKDFDRMVANWVIVNKKLPDELGGFPLKNPIVKLKSMVPYNDLFDISFEMDMVDVPYIYEFKHSSANNSSHFAETLQIPFYFLVASLSQKDNPSRKIFDGIIGAWVYRFDPVYRRYDTSYIWRTKTKTMQAVQAIEENGPQIYKFFSEQGIL